MFKILREINTSKSPVPDGMTARWLKSAAEELAEPLTHLFDTSLQHGIVPAKWKQANVVPIHKKGDKCSASNYRPISLTSQLSKIMEKLVCNKIMNFVSENQLISAEQFGFMPRSNCTNQLLEVLDEWTTALESGLSILVVLFDVEKAFDKVPHSTLLSRLHTFGKREQMILRISSFLLDRSQIVKVEDTLSSKASVPSGIIQGSIIGLLLFILHIKT